MTRLELILDNIDLSPVEAKLTALMGVEVKLDEIEDVRNNQFSIQSSRNYAPESGVFKAGVKKVTICTFSNSYVDNDIERGEYLWMTWNLLHEHKRGGSNGIQILTACYYVDTNSWEFSEVGV